MVCFTERAHREVVVIKWVVVPKWYRFFIFRGTLISWLIQPLLFNIKSDLLVDYWGVRRYLILTNSSLCKQDR